MKRVRGCLLTAGALALGMALGEEPRTLRKYGSTDGKTFAPQGEIRIPPRDESERRAEEEARRRAKALGASLARTRLGAPAAACVRFSEDGRHLFAACPAEGILVLDADSGKEVGRFPKESAGVRQLALSPDGQLLAAAKGEGETTIWKVDGVPGRGPERTCGLQAVGRKGASILGLGFTEQGRSLATFEGG